MDKQIKSYLFRSAEVINKNFGLVLILSLTSIFIWSNETYTLMSFLLLAFVLLEPLIYGRFYEISSSEDRSTYSQLFKQHWLNYFIVSIIFACPIMLFGNLLDGLVGFVYKSLLAALINILGIYVFPLVFIKRERIFPLTSGIKCLCSNFKYSLPLSLLIFLIFVFKALIQIFISKSLQGNYTAITIVVFVQNVVLNYIGLSVFMTATMLLLNKTDFQEYLNPKPNQTATPDGSQVRRP